MGKNKKWSAWIIIGMAMFLTSLSLVVVICGYFNKNQPNLLPAMLFAALPLAMLIIVMAVSSSIRKAIPAWGWVMGCLYTFVPFVLFAIFEIVT